MRIKALLKLTVIVVFFAVVGAGFYFLLFPKLHTKPVAAIPDKFFGWRYPVVKFPIVGREPTQIAYSDIRDPGGVPQGLPVRLKIPTIGVDSAIEDALITIDGRMDVPAGSQNVAWFALGPHPGQEGSAVIGGHFGINNGAKFVFYDLDKLKVDDKIYIEDDSGKTLTFIIRSTKLFDRNADATTVFTSHDGLSHLNLITCEGVWNQTNGSYPERRVVFADAVEEGGRASDSFPRLFGIGARGVDVVALQTFLEQRGLLELPLGVIKGFFGRLTSAAVAKYQTSVGLSPVGIFGPLTRAKVIAELREDTNLPNTGTEEIRTSSTATNSPIQSQSFIQSAKSLYATPLDGMITSLLLIAIAFMVFKIIR